MNSTQCSETNYIRNLVFIHNKESGEILVKIPSASFIVVL